MTLVEPASFQLSGEQRRTVRAMAGFGMPVADIAAYLETDAATLRRHMGVELDRAALEANAKVAQALFTMATQQHNVAAAIFWMKARALWRDRPESGATQLSEQKPRYVIRTDPPVTKEEWLEKYAPEHARETIVVRTGVPRRNAADRDSTV